MSGMSSASAQMLVKPAFFVCDIQERFRPAIHEFTCLVATSRRLLEIARLFKAPVFVTEQNPKALGTTVAELDLAGLGDLHVGTFAKTKFSMFLPEVQEKLHAHGIQTVVLFGLESHVCVLQTTLELLQAGYVVHIVADAVSSCNKEEIPVALTRLRQAGAVVTTSESLAFQLMGDASSENFKTFSALVKAEKTAIATSLKGLLSTEGSTLKSSL